VRALQSECGRQVDGKRSRWCVAIQKTKHAPPRRRNARCNVLSFWKCVVSLETVRPSSNCAVSREDQALVLNQESHPGCPRAASSTFLVVSDGFTSTLWSSCWSPALTTTRVPPTSGTSRRKIQSANLPARCCTVASQTKCGRPLTDCVRTSSHALSCVIAFVCSQPCETVPRHADFTPRRRTPGAMCSPSGCCSRTNYRRPRAFCQ